MRSTLSRRPSSHGSCLSRPTSLAAVILISVTSLVVVALFQMSMEPLVKVEGGEKPKPSAPGLLRGVPDRPAPPGGNGDEVPKGLQVGPPVTMPGLLPKSPLQLDCHEFLGAEEASSAASLGDNTFEMVRTKTPVPFDMSIYPVEKDIYVSRTIRDSGCWECDLIQTVLSALQQSADSFLLDLGGNIGMMSLSAAAAGHDVYVWEPFRANFRHLCRSVEANIGFSDRIHLFNRALTRNETVVHFRDHQGVVNMGGIGISEYPGLPDGGGALLPPSAENVDYARGISMDSLIPWLPLPGQPLVIKVDVEGSEMEALAGAMEYLRQHQGNILFVYMEVVYAGLVERPNDADTVFQFLLSSGLKPYYWGTELTNDWHDWKFATGDVSWTKPSGQTS